MVNTLGNDGAILATSVHEFGASLVYLRLYFMELRWSIAAILGALWDVLGVLGSSLGLSYRVYGLRFGLGRGFRGGWPGAHRPLISHICWNFIKFTTNFEDDPVLIPTTHLLLFDGCAQYEQLLYMNTQCCILDFNLFID